MLLDFGELEGLGDAAAVFAEEKVRHHRVEVDQLGVGLEVPDHGSKWVANLSFYGVSPFDSGRIFCRFSAISKNLLTTIPYEGGYILFNWVFLNF